MKCQGAHWPVVPVLHGLASARALLKEVMCNNHETPLCTSTLRAGMETSAAGELRQSRRYGQGVLPWVAAEGGQPSASGKQVTSTCVPVSMCPILVLLAKWVSGGEFRCLPPCSFALLRPRVSSFACSLDSAADKAPLSAQSRVNRQKSGAGRMSFEPLQSRSHIFMQKKPLIGRSWAKFGQELVL